MTTPRAWNMAEGVKLREDGPVNDELKNRVESAKKEIHRTLTMCMQCFQWNKQSYAERIQTMPVMEQGGHATNEHIQFLQVSP